MAQKQLTRKERERLHHKQEILETSLRLFSAKGFHAVSMQEIAETSEFAVGTLYNFFDNKEELFNKLMDSCGERITGTILSILDGPGDEAERLANFFQHLPMLMEEHTEFIKLYVSELGTRGAKLSKRQEKENMDDVLNSRLEQLIRVGIDKGIFRSVDPLITAKAINSTVETLAFEIADQFDKAAATDMFNQVEQLFLTGLLLPRGQ
jgi:TetR/AcrR family transcriptional regulator